MTRKRTAFGTKEWEDAVYEHVSTHAHLEGAILDKYERLTTDESMPPAFRYLVQLILDDEVRHHRMFDDLAATISAFRNRTGEPTPVPSLSGFHADEIPITVVTEELLRIECDDLRELKEFAKQLKELRYVTIWSFMIELMIDDTKKHIKILEFIRDRAQDQPD